MYFKWINNSYNGVKLRMYKRKTVHHNGGSEIGHLIELLDKKKKKTSVSSLPGQF